MNTRDKDAFTPLPIDSDSAQARTGKYKTWGFVLVTLGGFGVLLSGALGERYHGAALAGGILCTLLAIVGLVLMAARATSQRQ